MSELEIRSAKRDTHVQSLERGLKILGIFNAEDPQMTLSEIATKTGLSRAATRRFLLTFEQLGYIEMDGREFRLTIKVLDFGYSYLSSLSLPEIAQPHLERLTKILHESASASVLDGHDIVYIARVPIRKIMSIRIGIGTRIPAHFTSMGRVILADKSASELKAYFSTLELEKFTDFTIGSKAQLLEEITKVRKQGWSIVDQELEIGLRSIAVPITSQAGRVVAAINVSTTTQSQTIDSMKKKMLPIVQGIAREISRDLKVWRPASDGLAQGPGRRLV
jgi:IclR family pca regulon transcriptional regulator